MSLIVVCNNVTSLKCFFSSQANTGSILEDVVMPVVCTITGLILINSKLTF